MSAKITIIIPVHNTEKYLSRCLDSILAQTFADFECILIDDCSEDNSVEICENYAKKDFRITMLKNSKNLGASLTRKKGLDYAKGEYIQFIDSDDYIEKDMLEKMYQMAYAENLDIVFCDMLVLEKNGNIRVFADINNKSKIEIIKNIGITIYSLTAGPCNKIIKKHIFDKVIFSNTNYAEDKYISLQTAYYAEKIGYINRDFYHYAKNDLSLSCNVKYGLRIKEDHFHNYKLIVQFLMEKYDNDINLFEPELSDGINTLKMEIMSDKNAMNSININELYVNANKRIFSKTWKTRKCKKVLFYLVVHKYPFAYGIFRLYSFLAKFKSKEI